YHEIRLKCSIADININDVHASLTTAVCSLSLHDALPISARRRPRAVRRYRALRLGGPLVAHPGVHGGARRAHPGRPSARPGDRRSEEHTSELQSRENIVCRLLLEKKKYIRIYRQFHNTKY